MRRPRPRTLPSRQRGVGAVEYILGTGVLLVLLLAPFPFHGTTLNVVQRVILAIQRQHAAYLYLAGMPSLPRGPGGLSRLPSSPVGEGSAGGLDSGDDLPLGYYDPNANAGESAGGGAPVGDASAGDEAGNAADGLDLFQPAPDNGLINALTDSAPPNGGPGNGSPAVCAIPGATPISGPIPGAAQPTHIAATHVGNPINVVTGNKFERQIDLAGLPGAHGLAFVRYYNSRTAYTGALGHNWRSNYSLQLQHTPHGIALWQADGRRIDFHVDHRIAGTTARVYRAAQYGDGRLIVGEHGITWVWRDGTTLLLDRHGVLLSISDPAGRRTRIEHDRAGRVTRVTDPRGRTLKLRYNAQGRLARLIDPAGAITAYRYDERGNLVQVIGPEGRVRRYHYDDPYDAHNLTGISRGRMPADYEPAPLAPPEPPDNPTAWTRTSPMPTRLTIPTRRPIPPPRRTRRLNPPIAPGHRPCPTAWSRTPPPRPSSTPMPTTPPKPTTPRMKTTRPPIPTRPPSRLNPSISPASPPGPTTFTTGRSCRCTRTAPTKPHSRSSPTKRSSPAPVWGPASITPRSATACRSSPPSTGRAVRAAARPMSAIAITTAWS
ncbi:RHS repeat domain-containing protein [Salinisphaera sp.]|uniref:RHS repeat domain-containing protein n=1 Tax=Salinisphaera sp. TaxID=1914330 RepID=UPI002D77F302|nr:RHS repeat domain-containing protein [Salinisphaera sp.]HET7315337.1 RHS repeat domain-containing protein [Salinisphaera sp.]